MASIGELKIEVEVRVLEIKPNLKWRWWKFWAKKELRILVNKDDLEKV